MREIKFHPSYGYADLHQIARLKEIGVGNERDQILKDIKKQTAAESRKKKGHL